MDRGAPKSAPVEATVRLPGMITRAHIRNFRCLADVDITFEPLTILVGPNASGKSAILDALQRSFDR
jgi:predicted ATP-dependent endonuclease of OLD family